jgi:hypothetical protein
VDSVRPEGQQPQSSDQSVSEGLTSIRGAYTVSTPHEPHTDEVESLMVKRFLHTLAEVSLAIASRKVRP